MIMYGGKIAKIVRIKWALTDIETVLLVGIMRVDEMNESYQNF